METATRPQRCRTNFCILQDRNKRQQFLDPPKMVRTGFFGFFFPIIKVFLRGWWWGYFIVVSLANALHVCYVYLLSFVVFLLGSLLSKVLWLWESQYTPFQYVSIPPRFLSQLFRSLLIRVPLQRNYWERTPYPNRLAPCCLRQAHTVVPNLSSNWLNSLLLSCLLKRLL